VLVQQSENIQPLFLLPGGEGQDEGERQNLLSIPDAVLTYGWFRALIVHQR
jgi:hypothetical protein